MNVNGRRNGSLAAESSDKMCVCERTRKRDRAKEKTERAIYIFAPVVYTDSQKIHVNVILSFYTADTHYYSVSPAVIARISLLLLST